MHWADIILQVHLCKPILSAKIAARNSMFVSIAWLINQLHKGSGWQPLVCLVDIGRMSRAGEPDTEQLHHVLGLGLPHVV